MHMIQAICLFGGAGMLFALLLALILTGALK